MVDAGVLGLLEPAHRVGRGADGVGVVVVGVQSGGHSVLQGRAPLGLVAVPDVGVAQDGVVHHQLPQSVSEEVESNDTAVAKRPAGATR